VATTLAAAAPFLLTRKGSHYLETLQGRLGGLDPSQEASVRPGGLWIHAVSVGEVAVASTLARELPRSEPSVVTTITPTGQKRARAAFADRSAVAYLPFDLGLPLGRFYRRFEPRALVLVEGDLWPLALSTARRRGLPVAVINGRVGDRSFERLESLEKRGLPRQLVLDHTYGAVDRFGVQSDLDRERLERLGVAPEKITVTGNLKYESPEPDLAPSLHRCLVTLSSGRPLVVAGSTMPGEEEIVLDAFRRIVDESDHQVLMVLAPRHPERWHQVADMLGNSGLRCVRRSTVGSRGGAASAPPPDILLLDSLGELPGLYKLAATAFVGGTLVPTGGHNPVEPARFGVPVAVGPSMENFRQMAREFDRADAWARVADADQLAELWRRWLTDRSLAEEVGARGRTLVDANRGALPRTVELLDDLLAPAGFERPGHAGATGIR
jgi:3-deoxy-D-manno-octulosonic-acid transferase